MLIIVEKSKDEVINKMVNLIKIISDKSIKKDGYFNVGVSGGSLGTFLSIGLPKIKTDFNKWRIFFCDERVVPENSSDSTYGFYKTNLMNSINLKEEQFIKIKQGVTAEEAAEDYLQQISKYFPEGVPSFDLLLLGVGPDGHTCSLFPGHKLLNENSKWVAAITDSPKPPPCRITLTLPVINNAKNCLFALAGKEKADIVKKILIDKEDLPCTRVKPLSGSLYWILDAEAGKFINKN